MRNVNPVYHHSNQMLFDELEWITKAKEDPKYFAPLYEKYYNQIFRYVNQRATDDEMADDVTSQVFLKAIKNLDKYEYRGVPLGSWLYRIAKSELNQAFRDDRAKREIKIDHAHVVVFMEVFEEESTALNRKKLLNALAQLNGLDLQLVEMRYFEERSYREIGEILGITENNSKVKTFRAIEKLKRLFNQ